MRECPGGVLDTSISGKRVERELTAIIDARGKPEIIVYDNGTESTSSAIQGAAGGMALGRTGSADAKQLRRIF